MKDKIWIKWLTFVLASWVVLVSAALWAGRGQGQRIALTRIYSHGLTQPDCNASVGGRHWPPLHIQDKQVCMISFETNEWEWVDRARVTNE